MLRQYAKLDYEYDDSDSSDDSDDSEDDSWIYIYIY